MPASAHVTVDPSTAEQGSFAKLSAFNVPNETDNLNTVKVDVQMPQDHPIASVAVKPKPGWTYVATKTALATPITTDDGTISEAVSEIVWTATGDGIKPGEFDQFEIEVGPASRRHGHARVQDHPDLLRRVSRLVDRAARRQRCRARPPRPDAHARRRDLRRPLAYSTSVPSASDVVVLFATATTQTASAAHDDESNDNNGRRLAFVALLVGIVGVVLGGMALARSRKGPSTP